MTRHDVAKTLAAARGTYRDTVSEDPDVVLDVLAETLAKFLPPSQRDQFLIVSGTRYPARTPEPESNAAWLRRMTAEHGHCSQ